MLYPLKKGCAKFVLKAPSVVQSQFSSPSKEVFCTKVISLGKLTLENVLFLK